MSKGAKNQTQAGRKPAAKRIKLEDDSPTITQPVKEMWGQMDPFQKLDFLEKITRDVCNDVEQIRAQICDLHLDCVEELFETILRDQESDGDMILKIVRSMTQNLYHFVAMLDMKALIRMKGYVFTTWKWAVDEEKSFFLERQDCFPDRRDRPITFHGLETKGFSIRAVDRIAQVSKQAEQEAKKAASNRKNGKLHAEAQDLSNGTSWLEQEQVLSFSRRELHDTLYRVCSLFSAKSSSLKCKDFEIFDQFYKDQGIFVKHPPIFCNNQVVEFKHSSEIDPREMSVTTNYLFDGLLDASGRPHNNHVRHYLEVWNKLIIQDASDYHHPLLANVREPTEVFQGFHSTGSASSSDMERFEDRQTSASCSASEEMDVEEAVPPVDLRADTRKGDGNDVKASKEAAVATPKPRARTIFDESKASSSQKAYASNSKAISSQKASTSKVRADIDSESDDDDNLTGIIDLTDEQVEQIDAHIHTMMAIDHNAKEAMQKAEASEHHEAVQLVSYLFGNCKETVITKPFDLLNTRYEALAEQERIKLEASKKLEMTQKGVSWGPSSLKKRKKGEEHEVLTAEQETLLAEASVQFNKAFNAKKQQLKRSMSRIAVVLMKKIVDECFTAAGREYMRDCFLKSVRLDQFASISEKMTIDHYAKGVNIKGIQRLAFSVENFNFSGPLGINSVVWRSKVDKSREALRTAHTKVLISILQIVPRLDTAAASPTKANEERWPDVKKAIAQSLAKAVNMNSFMGLPAADREFAEQQVDALLEKFVSRATSASTPPAGQTLLPKYFSVNKSAKASLTHNNSGSDSSPAVTTALGAAFSASTTKQELLSSDRLLSASTTIASAVPSAAAPSAAPSVSTLAAALSSDISSWPVFHISEVETGMMSFTLTSHDKRTKLKFESVTKSELWNLADCVQASMTIGQDVVACFNAFVVRASATFRVTWYREVEGDLYMATKPDGTCCWRILRQMFLRYKHFKEHDTMMGMDALAQADLGPISDPGSKAELLKMLSDELAHIQHGIANEKDHDIRSDLEFALKYLQNAIAALQNLKPGQAHIGKADWGGFWENTINMFTERLQFPVVAFQLDNSTSSKTQRMASFKMGTNGGTCALCGNRHVVELMSFLSTLTCNNALMFDGSHYFPFKLDSIEDECRNIQEIYYAAFLTIFQKVFKGLRCGQFHRQRIYKFAKAIRYPRPRPALEDQIKELRQFVCSQAEMVKSQDNDGLAALWEELIVKVSVLLSDEIDVSDDNIEASDDTKNNRSGEDTAV